MKATIKKIIREEKDIQLDTNDIEEAIIFWLEKKKRIKVDKKDVLVEGGDMEKDISARIQIEKETEQKSRPKKVIKIGEALANTPTNPT